MYLTNSRTCTQNIVFVSSEGKVLPLLNETSSASRKVLVCEIVDVPDAEAQRLLSLTVSEDLSISFVKSN